VFCVLFFKDRERIVFCVLAQVVETLVLRFAPFKVQGSTPHGCKQSLVATPLGKKANDLTSFVQGNFPGCGARDQDLLCKGRSEGPCLGEVP
jgi:hypothetical protein